MILLTRSLIFILLVLVSVENSFANCQGCCSGHKGIKKISGVPISCKDGSAISQRCRDKGCGPKVAITTSAEKKGGTVVKIGKCQPKKDSKTSYHKLFFYPADEDRDCKNTRAEILIAQSTKNLGFKRKKQCLVTRGQWEDYYSGKIYQDAKKLQIDHVVSLSDAWISGACKWSRKRRKVFGNDRENLVVTLGSINQSKGSRGPDGWNPTNHKLACRYLRKYLAVKKKYGLQVTREQRSGVLRCK